MDEVVLKDIGLYKNRLVSAILNSNNIIQLLLNKDTYSDEEVDDLMYTQIFPYLYVDGTQIEVLSYLCLEVNVPRIPTTTIKDIQIIIWAYCHKDCMKYSKKGFLGTRVDILSDMVERELRDSDRFGIGKLRLTSVSHFFPNNKYYGREMRFIIPDFKVK